MLFFPLVAVAAPPNFDAEQTQLIRQLSHRDGSEPCQKLVTGDDRFRADLLMIVEHVEQPAWVGMRAASCIIELYPSKSVDVLEKWMTSENTMGLAYLLSTKIETLPEVVALRIGKAGVNGPHAQGVIKRIEANDGPIGNQVLENVEQP